MITKLQLGASRLEGLDPKTLQVFLDKTWMHLGDPEPKDVQLKGYSISYFIDIFGKHSISYIVKRGFQKFCRYPKFPKKSRTRTLGLDEIYSRTNFMEFYYHKGDVLPFDDNCIEYIFSEHFFEHLFFDEALALLKECYRVLKAFGVIRTCVPDADLRTYEPPEPVGFPHTKLPHTAPSKHKTRWSVYSYAEALRIVGFEPIPLRYCDKSGQYICRNPSDNRHFYEHCPDHKTVFDLSHIMRIDSLIIDGIKRPSK